MFPLPLPAIAFVHTSEAACADAASVQIRITLAATWIPPTSVTTDPRFAVLQRGLPNYESLLLRKLGGALVAIGGVFELNINGNRCSFRIESIDDGHNNNNIKIARVNRASTRIVILPMLVSIGNTLLTSGMDKQVENLAQIIIASYSNADAHRVLNIPPKKTTIVHGVAGVGKVTLVRAVCHTLGYNLCTLSVSMILAAKDQAEDESFANINPIKTLFNKAKMSVPVVVMVKDLDLLGQDSQLDDTAKSLVVKILTKEIGDVIHDKKIFVIGISRDRSKLPEIMLKLQREQILKSYLSCLSLQPVINILDVVEYYTREISQRTSGYVARDLAQVCRWATLRAMRRWDTESKTTDDHVDALVRGMAEMTVVDDSSKADAYVFSIHVHLSLCFDSGCFVGKASYHIMSWISPRADKQVSWQDFEYALSISKPSQQVEFESTLPKRNWDDIGGYVAIKKRMQQVVHLPLLKPEVYANLGIIPPSGLLLYGPSGSKVPDSTLTH
ncbi:hypothetical protein BC937DRAFT_89570 [Endogone sp. FLAS-F59071]|nr:hypothetical protein BC937DRAFT_89570 [Endogone sp. FLAS-F59071]|eukprot:RUS23262.1 hypothetical protein BC937DRAFT_89570 [Endogone sp. FLAS-F59071]